MSRIESRPTKRSLGEYLFFLDIEASVLSSLMTTALRNMSVNVEILKIFGSYTVLTVDSVDKQVLKSDKIK